MPTLAGLVLDMKSLAELPDGGFGPALAPLITAYAQWLEEQRGRVPALADLHPYQNTAHTALEQCQQTLARIQDGIALLDQNPQAAQAFRFANQAMHRQRVRSLYAGADGEFEVRRSASGEAVVIGLCSEEGEEGSE